MILISGWLGTADNFIPMFELFAKDYKCLAIDLPGMGKSSPMNMPHTINNYALFLDRFIRENHLKDPVLVGISLGASILLSYSVLFGNENTKLVIQSPVYKPFEVDMKGKIEICLVSKIHALTSLVLALTKFRWFQKLVYLFGDKNVKSVSEGYLSEYGLKSLHATSTKALIECLKDIMKFDAQNDLRNAKGEFLLVFGSGENLFDKKYRQGLQSLLPDCHFRTINGGSHYAMIQKPQEFTQLINDFVKG